MAREWITEIAMNKTITILSVPFIYGFKRAEVVFCFKYLDYFQSITLLFKVRLVCESYVKQFKIYCKFGMLMRWTNKGLSPHPLEPGRQTNLS